jgi:hypothetical protein
MGFGKRANRKWILEYFGGLGALEFRVCKGLLEFSRATDVNQQNKWIGSHIYIYANNVSKYATPITTAMDLRFRGVVRYAT